MDDFRNRYSTYKRSRDSLERKMDNWIQTGRQVVDGVAGNRPGKRRSDNQNFSSRSKFDNVGRWVGEKIDWFLEEEEDWLDNNEEHLNMSNSFSSKKRPLKAISLRGTKALAPEIKTNETNSLEESWPDKSSFQIDRWQRKEQFDDYEPRDDDQSLRENNFKKRQLPKSSRRRGMKRK